MAAPASRRPRPISAAHLLDDVDDEEDEVSSSTSATAGAKVSIRRRLPARTDSFQEALSSLLWEPYDCREDQQQSLPLPPPATDLESGWPCFSRPPLGAPEPPPPPLALPAGPGPGAGAGAGGKRSSSCQSDSSRGTVRTCSANYGHRTMLVNVADPAASGEVTCSASVLPSASVSVSDCHVSNVEILATSGEQRQVTPERTFTSTEAQTDDVGPAPVPPNREQRRRERRERRHARRSLLNGGPQSAPSVPAALGTALLGTVPLGSAPQASQAAAALWQTQLTADAVTPVTDRLPDLLHSHLPPPYTTLPLLGIHHVLPSAAAAAAPPASPPPTAGLRFPFPLMPSSRRRSTRGEDEPKSCCGVLVGQPVSIRWFILLILLVGLCCAVVGTVLGAMKASGREHLTVSLLMIGVGIVLVTVSGVAWRLTSQDATSCRMTASGSSATVMSGCGDDPAAGEQNRRFVPRLPPSYGRPHHPYAAMMYPEFQFRPPPPSYQASMQEYRLRLLLLDRHPSSGAGAGASAAASGIPALSPPPTYRSHAASLLRRDPASEYSRPPSYRSRSSSTRPSLEAGVHSNGEHSRDPSLSPHSDPGAAAGVSVITVSGDTDKVPRQVFDDPTSATLQMMLQKDPKENLVTIVQTGAGGDTSPVIVTVSGSSHPHCGDPTEMEILAHL